MKEAREPEGFYQGVYRRTSLYPLILPTSSHKG